jgi:hypothetical protein
MPVTTVNAQRDAAGDTQSCFIQRFTVVSRLQLPLGKQRFFNLAKIK